MANEFIPSLVLGRDKKLIEHVKDLLLKKEHVAVLAMQGNGKEYPFLSLAHEFTKMKLNHKVKYLSTVSEQELRTFLQDLKEDDSPTYALVSVRIGKDVSWFVDELENLRIKRGDGFVSLINAYVQDVYEAFTTPQKFLINHLSFLTRVSESDAENLINEFSATFDFTPTQEQKKEIFESSMGHVGLIRTLFLLKKQYPENEFTQEFLLGEPTVIQRINGIIAGFPPHVLKGIRNNSLPQHEKLLLEHIGLLVDGELFNPLVRAYAYAESARQTSVVFTQTELEALNFLRSKEGVMVTKKELVEAIWGKDNLKIEYSDLAMSQLLHRIREKLARYNPHASIKTKRGGGYMYQEK